MLACACMSAAPYFPVLAWLMVHFAAVHALAGRRRQFHATFCHFLVSGHAADSHMFPTSHMSMPLLPWLGTGRRLLSRCHSVAGGGPRAGERANELPSL